MRDEEKGPFDDLCADPGDESEYPEPEHGQQDDVCAEVSSRLVDYQFMGDRAARQMPEVARHLEHCHKCAEALSDLRENAQSFNAWEQVARDLREQEKQRVLWLEGARWVWGAVTSILPAALSPMDVETHTPVGKWSLRLAAAGERWTSLGHTAPPLAFAIRLAARVGEIMVTIVPYRPETDNRELWRVKFELNADSLVPAVDVGVGTASNCTTGMREMRCERPVEFSVPPPNAASYWVYFEWMDEGRVQHAREELPLRAAGEDTQQ